MIASLAALLCRCRILPTKPVDTQPDPPQHYTGAKLSKVFSATIHEHFVRQ
jgi:hypothetical protein